ncbi:MAG: hypothetical protein ACTSUK_07755 [Promethearchaeota archaeon]
MARKYSEDFLANSLRCNVSKLVEEFEKGFRDEKRTIKLIKDEFSRTPRTKFTIQQENLAICAVEEGRDSRKIKKILRSHFRKCE